MLQEILEYRIEAGGVVDKKGVSRIVEQFDARRGIAKSFTHGPKYTSSFAPRLGKIGHMMRDDSGGTRADELRHLIRQVGLIKIAKVCWNSL